MTPKAGESVWYQPCLVTTSVLLACYGGPFDGQDGWDIMPGLSDDGIFILSSPHPEKKGTMISAHYKTAWRWTKKHGFEGIVLVWVPDGQ